MADWARITNTTIAEYIKGEEINVMRNRKILALLQDRGRVTFNHSGTNVDWKVRYRRVPMTGFADSDTITFSRQNRHKAATLDWRGYSASDMMTGFEKEKNKGDAAIVKLWSEMARMLMDDIEDQFGDEVYIDGNATGNTKRFHGLESIFSTSGASTVAPIGLPNDTYAGLSTTLGNYGGSWTTTSASTWPIGTGDANYDFWSPLIVDYKSAVAAPDGWAASTKTWPNTCLEALRFGIIHSKKNKSKRGQLDMIDLNDQMHRQFLDKLQTEEQINVTRGQNSSALIKLGFTDVTNFDGTDVTSEYGIASGVGYGLPISEMEIQSLVGELFSPKGPDYDIATDAWRFAIRIMGNMKFTSPRPFVKWAGVS